MKLFSFLGWMMLLLTPVVWAGSKKSSPPEPEPPDDSDNSGEVACDLIIPDNPLTAEGLATPYELINCNMLNLEQSTFVQATIFDTDMGSFSVYSPLVIDFGTLPASNPVIPVLPSNYIIGIWFGSNADVLTLRNEIGLRNGRCVNGFNGSVFGQFAYCNAPEFFEAVRNSKLIIQTPPLNIALDGKICPTARDFLIVDADPSDNLHTTYLGLPGGVTAQDTAINRDRFKGLFTVLFNPSDEALLTNVFYPVLNCTAWVAPDLADGHRMVASLALNEIHARIRQKEPSALIPARDPFVLVEGALSLEKLNLYRLGVDQPVVNHVDEASTVVFCQYFFKVGFNRLRSLRYLFIDEPSPDPQVAINLYTFLMERFRGSFDVEGLGCTDLLGIPNPIQTVLEGNLVVDIIITPDSFVTPPAEQVPVVP